MTAARYNAALQAIGLTQVGAASVLRVSRRTAQNYAIYGPTDLAALAIELLLELPASKRGKYLG